ncbi:UDP-N-acetylglucosamine 2-epimerase [Pseudodesulfovibrio sp. zrk46]|uniref:UDP-N-acetylglucosamine 2-epimerase n=1 Tax=Pseudodesulfovibrio sp. zrk46 TaxID=2725288 RepID=UPI001B35C594|nr:UDP-N-acetylglucosamine 2-epimerase [Pseudodesulfovibrio sp. zrk46]
MKKVCVFCGSRANYSSCKPLMKAIQAHPDLSLQVVLGGAAVLQRYGNIEDLIRKDGFEIDAKFHMIVEGETPATMSKSTGLGIIEMTMVLNNLTPDVVLVVGDRFDIMAPAVAATMMNIPLAHTMGGEVSGTIDESIRHAVTKLAHIHFPANEDAKQRIIKLGEPEDMVFNVGCPRMDLVSEILSNHKNGERLCQERFWQENQGLGSGFDIEKEPFLLVSHHPVTTEYGSNRQQVESVLYALEELQMPVIMIWPNVDAGSDEVSKGIRTFRENRKPEWLNLFINLPVDVYTKLMDLCACMVGNSSSALREGAFVGVPAVNVGTRQNSRVHGDNVIYCAADKDEIVTTIKKQLEHGKYDRSTIYGAGDSGQKIASILSELESVSVQKLICY